MPPNGHPRRAEASSENVADASVMAAAAAASTSTSTATISAEALDRALGYPYARPPSSFVWSWHSSGDDDDSGSESASPHGSVRCFDDRAWASFAPASGEAGAEGEVGAEGEAGEGGGGRGVSAERLAEELSLPLPSARALAAALESVFSGGEAGTMTAVLAIGSNAGPSQLARKFPRETFPSAAVPVLRAMLRGHDVCYAPLISSYGSVTATLHEVEEDGEGRGEGEGECEGGGGEGQEGPGGPRTAAAATTSVEVWVTFLSPDLLHRMHETEACYDLQRLDCPGPGSGSGSGSVAGEEGTTKDLLEKENRRQLLALGTCADSAGLGREPAAFLRSALCYTHQAGSLLLPAVHVSAARELHGGEEGARGRGGRGGAGGEETEPGARTLVAVAEVRALNRRLPSLPQRGAQAAVAAALADQGHGKLPPAGEAEAEADAEAEAADGLLAGGGVEAWVARNVTDEGHRQRAVALLVEGSALRFASPAATRLEQLGSVFGRSVD